jgi:chemotaxis methyl-accepting protein methylase
VEESGEHYMAKADDLDPILDALKEQLGIDLNGYRRSTLNRRIAVRMGKLCIRELSDYINCLEANPAECERLVDTIAINVSSFFRDPLVFELLARRIVPAILSAKRERLSRETRVWSAGCATGEEAYSMAILLHQSIKEDVEKWSHLVFATDIDGEALAQAEKGVYRRAKLDHVKLGLFDRYFKEIADGCYEVHSGLRTMVHFSRHDLSSASNCAPAESIFASFDLILCRNTLIYFTPELQRHVMMKLYKALAPQGYLVLGTAESLIRELETRCIAVDKQARIYQKRA